MCIGIQLKKLHTEHLVTNQLVAIQNTLTPAAMCNLEISKKRNISYAKTNKNVFFVVYII